jgi:hypothetical protein
MEIRYGILSPKVTFGGLVPPDVCFYGWKTENGTRVKVRPIQYLELLISCYDRLSAVIQDKLEQNIQEVLDLIEGVLQNEINIGSESLN